MSHERTQSPSSPIKFRHPGCPDLTNVLFSLRRHDTREEDGARGVHHETARVACAIVAGNKWDGYFTVDKEGETSVGDTPDEILLLENYYFWPTRGCKPDFPIVPKFSDWAFPHEQLPRSWAERWNNMRDNEGRLEVSQLSAQIRVRDKTCRLSNYDSSLETAHLVPRSEKEWFEKNSMNIYCYYQDKDYDDKSNALLLRQDIHNQLDAAALVFTPKEQTLKCHVLGESRSYKNDFHNSSLWPLDGVSKQFLFSRFARTIFSYTSVFARDPKNGRVGFLVTEENALPRVIMPGMPEFKIMRPSPKSRTPSPRKRGRLETGEEDNGLGDTEKRTPSHRVKRPCITTKEFQLPLISYFREEFLREERQKSDPAGTWLKTVELCRRRAEEGESNSSLAAWVEGEEDLEFESRLLEQGGK